MLKTHRQVSLSASILLHLVMLIALFMPAAPVSAQSEEPRSTERVEGTCQTLRREECPIIDYLIDFTNLLGAAVGTIVVIVIAVAGVQYTTARDNPQVVAAARQRIYNALIALVVYLTFLGFLQWIVPGGVFSG